MPKFDWDRSLAACPRGAGLTLALFLLASGAALALPTPQGDDPGTQAETTTGNPPATVALIAEKILPKGVMTIFFSCTTLRVPAT